MNNIQEVSESCALDEKTRSRAVKLNNKLKQNINENCVDPKLYRRGLHLIYLGQLLKNAEYIDTGVSFASRCKVKLGNSENYIQNR